VKNLRKLKITTKGIHHRSKGWVGVLGPRYLAIYVALMLLALSFSYVVNGYCMEVEVEVDGVKYVVNVVSDVKILSIGKVPRGIRLVTDIANRESTITVRIPKELDVINIEAYLGDGRRIPINKEILVKDDYELLKLIVGPVNSTVSIDIYLKPHPFTISLMDLIIVISVAGTMVAGSITIYLVFKHTKK